MDALKNYSTKELHEELLKREAVREITISLENELVIHDKVGEVARISGPARILINQD